MSFESKRLVFLDTETTGTLPINEAGQIHDRIIEIGLVEVIDRKKTGRKIQLYMCSDKEVDVEAERVHGLSMDDVRRLSNGKQFKDHANEILEFIGTDGIVAHNADFDKRFINAELNHMGLPTLESMGIPINCTKKLADALYIGQRNSLDTLCNRLNIDKTQRQKEGHGALLDTELLVDVYLQMTTNQLGLLNKPKVSVVNLLTELNIEKISTERSEKLKLPTITEEEKKMHNLLNKRIAKDSGDNSLLIPF